MTNNLIYNELGKKNKKTHYGSSSVRTLHMRFLLVCLLVVLRSVPCDAMAVADEDSLLCMLRDVVNSKYEKFRNDSVPANFVGIRVNEVKTVNIESLLGVTTHKDTDSFRQFAVNIKIGTTQSKFFGLLKEGLRFDNSYSAEECFYGDLAHLRWAVSDKLQAVYDGMSKNPKAFRIVNDSLPNLKDVNYYSYSASVRYYEPPSSEKEIEKEKWESILNEACSVFRENDVHINATMKLRCRMERMYLFTSDGSEIVSNKHSYVLSISAQIITEKGKECSLTKEFSVTKMEDLPTKEDLKQTAEELQCRLRSLYLSSCIDSYDGPVLFGGIATGVLMHEVIGHRLESVKSQDAISPMLRHRDNKLFADFIQISDDPTMKEYAAIPLVGHYLYDDEGVPAQKVDCIKDGAFVSYLTSRTPFYKGSVSNGHGRGVLTKEPVARQANLFVSSSVPYTDSQLREMLIAEIRKQNKEFGYYIPMLTSGGESATPPHLLGKKVTTDSISDFMTTLEYAYRVYADGRPDEIVSGGMFLSSPLKLMHSITALGTECEVNNGSCGASSGNIPVSLIAPKMFVANMKWTIPKVSQQTKVRKLLPMIPELSFQDEQTTILNALEDEMAEVRNTMRNNDSLSLCFADYIVNSEVRNSYMYTEGQCGDSLKKKEMKGNVRLYCGDEQSVIESTGSQFNFGFSLPLTADYFVIRHIMRDKTYTAYDNALKQNSKTKGQTSANSLLRKFPAVEYISRKMPCGWNEKMLRDLSRQLSLDMSKHHEFQNSFVWVDQIQYDDYRVTSERQKILKRQVYLRVVGHADVIMNDGATKHKMIELQFLDADASSVIKEFRHKLKETLQDIRQEKTVLTVDKAIDYEGPVLVEEESVKDLVFKSLNNCFLDRALRNDSKAKIGDVVLNEQLSVSQLSGISKYKGEKLWGYEEYDMDGVIPESVILVDKGILRNKLGGKIGMGGSLRSTGNERINRCVTKTDIGVIRISSSETQKHKTLKSEFIRKAKAAGQKYVYILKNNECEDGNVVIRVDTETKEEVRMECKYKYSSQEAELVAVSREECLAQERNYTPRSVIYPKAILYDRFKLSMTKK